MALADPVAVLALITLDCHARRSGSVSSDRSTASCPIDKVLQVKRQVAELEVAAPAQLVGHVA
jgi:hypothetical protein